MEWALGSVEFGRKTKLGLGQATCGDIHRIAEEGKNFQGGTLLG
jgi:hypothetical protein